MLIPKLLELAVQLVADESSRQKSNHPEIYRGLEAFHILKFFFGK